MSSASVTGKTSHSSAALARKAIRLTPTYDVSNVFIEALTRAHRASWAAPGLFKTARAEHLAKLLRCYSAWHLSTTGSRPRPLHIAAVAEAMLAFPRRDAEQPSGMNPWVIDADFAEIRQQVELRIADDISTRTRLS